jgi:hypothetical protein
MLPSDRYTAFTTALAARGVSLFTGGEQYRRAHELPGWSPALAALTPASVWTVDVDRNAFARACRRLGPGAERCTGHRNGLSGASGRPLLNGDLPY